MVLASDEVNEDVKYTCEKERKDEIHDRSEKVVDNGIRYRTGTFVNWLDTSISPSHDRKECPHNTVRPNNSDNNQRSSLSDKLRASKSTEWILKGLIAIHADGQKGKDRCRYSDEVNRQKGNTHRFAMFPLSVQ